MKKPNKGITLIALVITIIVLLILAGVTIATLTQNNGILKKSEIAKVKTEYESAKEIIEMKLIEIVADCEVEGRKYNLKEIIEGMKNAEDITILKCYNKEIASIKDEVIIGENPIGIVVSANQYPKYKFLIGESLQIEKVTTDEITEEIKMEDFKDLEELDELLGNNNDTNNESDGEKEKGKIDKSKNRDLAGETENYTYRNPIIPQGFIAIDTPEAQWKYKGTGKTEVQGWNDGLVIEDDKKNQFVWVPVDGNNIIYDKWCTLGVAYTSCSDFAAAIPVDENLQINKYQGFYVARYEAGTKVDGLIVSKEGEKPISRVTYNNAYASANQMINDENIYGKTISGLVTGKQWDTIMAWYNSSGIAIDETQTWGSYYQMGYNIQPGLYSTNGSTWQDTTEILQKQPNSCYYHATGLNLEGMKKNIADMSGNLWELIAEANAKYKVIRGGACINGQLIGASRRGNVTNPESWQYIGFRVVLYIS